MGMLKRHMWASIRLLIHKFPTT